MSSTQAYYKDRLGFDPKEEAYQGPNQKYRKTDATHHKQQQPYGEDVQDGYELNLTRFKGTTIWDFYIHSKGTVAGSPTETRHVDVNQHRVAINYLCLILCFWFY